MALSELEAETGLTLQAPHRTRVAGKEALLWGCARLSFLD